MIKRFFFAFGVGILFLSSTWALVLTEFSDRSDIPFWAEGPIEVLVGHNVFTGNDDGSFAPGRMLNRAEFCKLLVHATKTKLYIPLDASFPDVKRSDWFFEYVETAKREGWVDGYPDGTFRPGGKINRAEAAKIITQAFDIPLAPEQSGTPWYARYTTTLSERNLLPYDKQLSTLEEEGLPSRAEIAEQLFRVMKQTGKLTSYDITPYAQFFTRTSESPQPPADPTAEEPATTPYEYPQTDVPESVETSEGVVSVNKGDFERKTSVKKGDKNIRAHSLVFKKKSGTADSRIQSLQVRRIGKGSYRDFAKVWLETSTGNILTEKHTPTQDELLLEFTTPLSISSQGQEIILKVDISSSAQEETSSRFVLYLPEWIHFRDPFSATGFFPFGGTSLEIE